MMNQTANVQNSDRRAKDEPSGQNTSFGIVCVKFVALFIICALCFVAYSMDKSLNVS